MGFRLITGISNPPTTTRSGQNMCDRVAAGAARVAARLLRFVSCLALFTSFYNAFLKSATSCVLFFTHVTYFCL